MALEGEGDETVGREGADLVLAVDCSTTAAKAVVFDATGRALATGRHPIPLTRSAVGIPGAHEQHADDWWSATCVAVRAVVAQVDATRIASVTVTHQRESFVCLDGVEELRPAILWLDSRARREVEELGSTRVHEVSGRPPDTTPSLYKIAWLARHEPAVIERATRIGDVGAYLSLRLTDRWASSWASADSTGLMDMRTLSWSAELCDLAGIRVEQLPVCVRPGDVVGEVTAAAAAATGLRAGTPVVAGGGDGQCAAIGAGAVAPGTLYLNVGTALVCGSVSADYSFDRSYRTVAAAGGSGYLLEAFLSSGTYLVTWFCETFGPFGSTGVALAPEELLEVAAAKIAPGSGGLLALPYWNGAQTPHWDAAARGAVVGWTGGHTRAHLYRALLEGIAFEAKTLVDGVAAAVGAPHTRLVTGGGSRSALWAQVLADVSGSPLVLCAEPETTALGAGMIGATAAGLHPDLAAAAAAMGHLGRTVVPDPAAVAVYADLGEIHATLYSALRPAMTALRAYSP
ncbi:xylulokinase [Kineococcus rubinsiae]|uniref:xylulokinase n=1 Tax=Kineococcus rubinsiae TaxID=2609562 RepID=UPI0014302ED9|nr:FGGY family carbohydrate kinase [Kineococcus rubinsiae]